MMKKLLVPLFLVVLWCPLTRADELFFAEAEVDAGPQVSRITVTIVNNAHQELTLHTGSRGGPGQHDDRVSKKILGTPVTALPEFTFRSSNHWTTVHAPAFGSGMTRHTMRPYIFIIPPKSRRVYYSFQVPSLHIQGKFFKGRIVFPEANEVRPHFSRGTKELVVGIIKCSEKQPEEKSPEPSPADDDLKAAPEE
jgi:hypothetical protein